MPANTPIPTVSTGNVIAAATQNDMTVLNTCVGLFGGAAAVSGSLEATNAPNYQIQGGLSSVTFSAGLSTANVPFPVTYPNGVLAVIPIVNVVGATYTCNLTGCTTSGFSLGVANSGTGFTGVLNIVWIAIGC